MQSQAADVARYLEEVPGERLEALTRLRALCVSTLEGYEESMDYGMPCYAKDGVIQVAFASQKNYISLYILKEPVLDKHRPNLKGFNLGKGCIRYSKPEKINFAVVEQLLKDTLTTESDVC